MWVHGYVSVTWKDWGIAFCRPKHTIPQIPGSFSFSCLIFSCLFLNKNLTWNFLQLLGWLVAAPFILGVLHLLLLPCCKILVRKFSTAPSSPKKPLSAQIVRKLSSAPSSPNKALSSHTEVRLKVRDVWSTCNNLLYNCLVFHPICSYHKAACVYGTWIVRFCVYTHWASSQEMIDFFLGWCMIFVAEAVL